jgi:hypothetical protein
MTFVFFVLAEGLCMGQFTQKRRALSVAALARHLITGWKENVQALLPKHTGKRNDISRQARNSSLEISHCATDRTYCAT